MGVVRSAEARAGGQRRGDIRNITISYMTFQATKGRVEFNDLMFEFFESCYQMVPLARPRGAILRYVGYS